MPSQRYDDSPKSTSALTLRPSRMRSASRHPSLLPTSTQPSPLLQLTPLAPSPPPPYLPLSNFQAKLYPSPKFTATQPPSLPQLNLPNTLYQTSLPPYIQLPRPPIPNPPRCPLQSLHYHRTHPTSIATQRFLQTSLRTSLTTSLGALATSQEVSFVRAET